MCQFARSYPLNVLRSFIDTDARLSVPSIQKVADEVLKLNNGQFTQELTAQIQSTDSQLLEFTQEPLAQIQNVAKTVSAIYRITIEDIEKLFLASPVARINWASHVIMLNNSLPLGVKYWYMKQSVEMGWSSNVLKIQIETNLYNRQISNNKVNNFTATLPAPQSDLANYLLKDCLLYTSLKSVATDAATAIASGVGSLFGSGKLKDLEQSNENLRHEIAKRDKLSLIHI